MAQGNSTRSNTVLAEVIGMIYCQGLHVNHLWLNIMKSSNIFRVTGPLWGESTGHRWIPLTKASDAELWFFFALCLNKRLSKQSLHRWFETPSRSLWRHCNELKVTSHPDGLYPMQYLIRMTYHSSVCHSDDLAEVGILSGWAAANW